jgi:hypothetical protein
MCAYVQDFYNLAYPNEPQGSQNYLNRPEAACYAICQQQLGPEGCTLFTYDGLNKDACAPAWWNCSHMRDQCCSC